MRNSVNLANLKKGNYNYEEAVKTLRTNIQFCGSNIKVIMLESAVPNEGKSSMSFSLASSLAQIGKNVLLIDADIRKSVLVSRYQLDKEVNGLSQFLSGQKNKEEIIYETNLNNLNIVFSGPYSPNPAELLEEPVFSLLIQAARAEYDYIIIDTPPMMNLIDGAIIANHCDGAVLVIESGKVSYRVEQKIKKQLEKSGCRILGVILNNVNLDSGRYYGKYKKYGKYEDELQESE
ncbi:tyrosine protein kinase [Lacrimispora amygdalina]|uniref:non-specific protein-tyrosine kinase n=1 Tax=Lacrimispora amygdalina TaxID=253257 RepID=A0A3E2N6G2_9FIRM|nr:CpsD/CapB family tyrosine-protein kinase [Clostridium indicum]RFZ76534.1 tyrosine protein kinase [Clostridium indicum]